MLDAIRELWERLKAFVLNIIDGDSHNADGNPMYLEPAYLLGLVLKAIRSKRMVWPDVTELPSYVVVELSKVDYAYYSARQDRFQQYVLSNVERHAQQNNCVFETEPVIRLVQNISLPEGVVQVHASFFDEHDEGKTDSFNTAKTAFMKEGFTSQEHEGDENDTSNAGNETTDSRVYEAWAIPPTAVMNSPFGFK